MVLSKVCYFQVISPFSLSLFLYNDSDPEIAMKVRKHIQVYWLNVQRVGRCILGVTLCGKQGLWSVLKLVKIRCFGKKCHNLFIIDPNSVRPNVLVILQSILFCVIVSYQFNKYSEWGTLYKVVIQNKLEFNNVCHVYHKSFSKRFQVVTPGGIS